MYDINDQDGHDVIGLWFRNNSTPKSSADTAPCLLHKNNGNRTSPHANGDQSIVDSVKTILPTNKFLNIRIHVAQELLNAKSAKNMSNSSS